MATYSGSWKSTKYSKMVSCGDVKLTLMSKTFSKAYPTTAVLTYRGLYRKGASQEFNVMVQPIGREIKTEYTLPDTVTQGQKKQGGLGVLSFMIKSWSEDNQIQGSYKYKHDETPDEGTFMIRLGDHPSTPWFKI